MTTLVSNYVLYDVIANRPTFHSTYTAGRLFYATDEGKIYRDNGTSWDNLAIGGGVYQPLDADLTAIAALTIASGKFLVGRTDAWALDNILAADLPNMVGDSGAGGTKGAVPAPAAGDAAAGKYLKADGTWATPPTGSGDVVGPAPATDEALARFDTTTGKLLQDSGVTLDNSNNMTFPDTLLTRPVLKDYGETVHTEAVSGATETIDLTQGNVKDLTLTANCTLTFSNPTPTGNACSFTLILRQDGTGGWVTTWPASVQWAGGVAPTLTTAISAEDILTFMTVDAGTTWYGFPAGLDFS